MLSAQLSHALGEIPDFFFQLQIESRDLYPQIVYQLEQETGMDVGYRGCGLLYLVASQQQARLILKKVQWQKKRNFPVVCLSPREIRRQEPAIDGRFYCGFFFPKDSQVNNTCLTLAYAKAAQKRGVKFLLGHTAGRLLIQQKRVQGVQTASRRICLAPVVVNACGSWAHFDKSLPFKIPVFPAKGQMLVFQFRKERPLFQTPVLSHKAYGVPRGNGEFLVGTTVEQVGFDKRVTQKGKKMILEGFSTISTCLRGRSPKTAWAGFRPCTPDHLPILGPTPIQGFYLATGHFRDGILLSPMTARLITSIILKVKIPPILKPYLLERF